MCKRLVRATGNGFPEPVHVGCYYSTAWEYLKQLTQGTNSAKQDLVYNNFNMHNKTRHEHQG